MSKTVAVAVAVAAGAILLLGAIWIRDTRVQVAPKPAKVKEDFEIPFWIPFRVGEFRQSAIEAGESLRLAADTRGTPPGTWKHLGVRRAAPIRFREGTEISLVLDWVEHQDASFLSASIILSPHAVSGNPRNASDWIEVSYIGVPPGADARMAIVTCAGGTERPVFTDGWPEVNATGRTISRQKIRMRFQCGGFEIHENGRLVGRSNTEAVRFDTVYLYLMLSSESNFTLREVRFDDVEIRVP